MNRTTSQGRSEQPGGPRRPWRSPALLLAILLLIAAAVTSCGGDSKESRATSGEDRATSGPEATGEAASAVPKVRGQWGSGE